jgi:hypothetical protein
MHITIVASELYNFCKIAGDITSGYLEAFTLAMVCFLAGTEILPLAGPSYDGYLWLRYL